MEPQADRISALPEPIIHLILSHLPTKYVKLATSLSKTWYAFCSSFPYLDFIDYTYYAMYGDHDIIEYESDEDYFKPYLKPQSERFFNRIGETLSIFHERNPRILIRRIKIEVGLINSRCVLLLNDWILLALEHGFEKIDIKSRGFCHNLPTALFASNSIRVLKIDRGSLLDSFRHGDIGVSYSKLRKLEITTVCINELALRSAISNCPLLEKLVFKDPMGLTNLQIARLYKLKSLVVVNFAVGDIKMIEVDAPMLHFLEFSNKFNCPPVKVGIFKFPRLAKMILSDIEMENFQLEEILSGLTLLRCLRLTNVFLLTKFNISNNSLNKLAVIKCKHLVELEIDAPNLLSFVFHSNSVPLMAPMHTIMGRSNILLEIGWEPSFFENFSVKFRNFLSRLNCVNYLLIEFGRGGVEEWVVQPVNDIEFDSNSVPLVGPLHTITGTSRITLDIGREPLLYDNLVAKFRNFLSRMGRVDNLDIYLKHFGVINVDEQEEPVTNIEELNVFVEISESFHDILNGLLRSYRPHILIMNLSLFKHGGVSTFLRDISVCVGPCCSWLPYLEERTIVASKGNFVEDVIRLPMDGTLSSIALESYHRGKFKFVFKW